MSIHEMESVLGLKGDKIECPLGHCDNCPKGLDYETCEESYEEWLEEQIAGMEDLKCYP